MTRASGWASARRPWRSSAVRAWTTSKPAASSATHSIWRRSSLLSTTNTQALSFDCWECSEVFIACVAAGPDRSGRRGCQLQLVLLGRRLGLDDPEQRPGLSRKVDQVGCTNAPQRPVLLRRAAAVLERNGRIGQQEPGEFVIHQSPRHGPIDLPSQIFFSNQNGGTWAVINHWHLCSVRRYTREHHVKSEQSRKTQRIQVRQQTP